LAKKKKKKKQKQKRLDNEYTNYNSRTNFRLPHIASFKIEDNQFVLLPMQDKKEG